MAKQAITIQVENIEDNEDRAIFYSRMFSGVRLVIIPKKVREATSIKMTETDSSYVLEIKENN